MRKKASLVVGQTLERKVALSVDMFRQRECVADERGVRLEKVPQVALSGDGLNLVVAAIIFWNTVYLERAAPALRAAGHDLPDDKLAHVAPLSWEHIMLPGDYAWQDAMIAQAGQRPLGAIPSRGIVRAA